MPTKYSIKFPKDPTIDGRSSTIRGSFIKAIIPSLTPPEGAVNKALQILEQNQEVLSCSYCGDKASEWEHFRPIVQNKKATGYITEIYNLVPSCGKCNQSKRGEYWLDWINSSVLNSPKTRGVPNLDRKIETLKNFEEWSNGYLTKIPDTALESELVASYMESCENLISTLKGYQRKAIEIKKELIERLRNE